MTGVPASYNPIGTYVPLTSPGYGVYVAGLATNSPLKITDPSGTYGSGLVFGNVTSFGFSGTGSPLGIFAPFAIYQRYGDSVGGSNAPIPKTTQGGFVNAQYYGPTTDDSAEAFSTAVYLKNTGTGFTQSKKVVAFEADVQIEGSNNVAGGGIYILGQGTRIVMTDSSNADTAYGAKMSAATANTQTGGASGTIGTWDAFRDEIYNPAGTSFIANKSVHGFNRILSEQAIAFARSGYGASVIIDGAGTVGSLGNSALVLVQQPSPNNTTTIVDGGFTNLSNLMTTATAPTVSWIGRAVTNANVPAGTAVLNYYGTGPYTVVLTNNATATVSAQSVTITEPDLVGIKIIQGAGGVQRFMEFWEQGVSGAPIVSISRTGFIASQGGFQLWNNSGTAVSSWIPSAMTLNDATTIVVGTTTGTKIGTATNQKLGLWNTTPIVQPARAGQLTDNSGGTGGGNTIAAITGAVDPSAATVASTANAVATLAARLNVIEAKLSTAGGGIGVTA